MALMHVLTALAIVAGAVALLFLTQFGNRLLRGEDADDAASGAAGNTAVWIGALFAVLGAGLIRFADLLDVILNGIAAFPVLASNALVGLLGLLGIAGLVDVSIVGFALLVVVIVGGVLVVRRARE